LGGTSDCAGGPGAEGTGRLADVRHRGHPEGMTDETLLDVESAAGVLGVEPDRVRTMVEEGLLTPVEDREPPHFRETEVRAVRNLGG
jgi:hypothetical protein